MVPADPEGAQPPPLAAPGPHVHTPGERGTPSTASIGRGNAPRCSRLQRTPSSSVVTRSGGPYRRRSSAYSSSTPGSAPPTRTPIRPRGPGRASPHRVGRPATRTPTRARPRVTYSKRISEITGSKPTTASAPMAATTTASRHSRATEHESLAGHGHHHRQHRRDDARHHRCTGAQVGSSVDQHDDRRAAAPVRRTRRAGLRCARPARPRRRSRPQSRRRLRDRPGPTGTRAAIRQARPASQRPHPTSAVDPARRPRVSSSARTVIRISATVGPGTTSSRTGSSRGSSIGSVVLDEGRRCPRSRARSRPAGRAREGAAPWGRIETRRTG